MQRLAAAIIPFLIVGCTGVKNYSYVPSENDAMIFIFRDSQFNAGGVGAVFYVDGQNIVKLGTKEYAEVPISSGRHSIAVKGAQTIQKDEHYISVEEKEPLFYEVVANPSRLSPALLIPLLDLFAIETFLLQPSNKEDYESSKEVFNRETLKFDDEANKSYK